MRGQTTIDFAIGIAIFLGVMVFAFSFVPGILQPFELSGDEEPALSDRIANSLSQDMLGSAEQPHILDRYCTVAFFNDSNDASTDCNYEDEDIEELFNLRSFHNVNITLKGNTSAGGTETQQLCWSDESPPHSEPGLVERDDCDPGTGDVILAKGDEVRDGQGTTITARRVVLLDGESVTLEVVLW